MDISKIHKYLLTRYSIGGIIAAVLFIVMYFTHNNLDWSLQKNNLILKNISTLQDSVFQTKSKFQFFIDEKNLSKRNLLKRKLDQQFVDLRNNNLIIELTFNEGINSIPGFKTELNTLKREIQNITVAYRALSVETKRRLQAPFFILIKEHTMNINHSLNQLTLMVANHHQKLVADFSKYNLLILLASLLSLHLIIIFIFKPTTKKVISVIEGLNKEKNEAYNSARAKSDYLVTLSYQVRTPLNGVLGISELLLATNLNKEQREYLELIRDSGINLLQVINDIFDFSKIETGNLELEEVYFSLQHCIEDVVNTYLPRCQEKKLELVYIIEHDVPEYIFGDSQRFAQCLSNLVSNAVKFTRKGEIFIRVNLLSSFDNKHEIQFAVSDTGMGIPEALINTLFNPMPQSVAPVARKFEGTGLGLAIVSRIVQLMNGRIWVESEINIGTTFFIAINFLGKEAGMDYKNEQVLNQLSQKDVLILDQNESNRKTLSIQCHVWGMQPRNLDNIESLDVIIKNNQHFDFFILDYEILFKNKFEVLNNLRKNEMNENSPIIYMHSAKVDLLEKMGAMYLSKPIKKNELLDILLECAGFQNIKSKSKKTSQSKSSTLELLLAEDNIINQKLMKRMVSQLSYKLDIAEDGNQAIHMASIKKYDVIFMDLQMPEIDGIEATKTILANSSEPKPKVIAMTANVDQKDKELCFEAGMIDYYAKPIGFENIKKLLSHWENVK